MISTKNDKRWAWRAQIFLFRDVKPQSQADDRNSPITQSGSIMKNLQCANGASVAETTHAGSVQFADGESLGAPIFIPRQKPVRMAHPDLHHLVSKEAFFRSRRRGSLVDGTVQPECEAEQDSDATFKRIDLTNPVG